MSGREGGDVFDRHPWLVELVLWASILVLPLAAVVIAALGGGR